MFASSWAVVVSVWLCWGSLLEQPEKPNHSHTLGPWDGFHFNAAFEKMFFYQLSQSVNHKENVHVHSIHF